MYRRGRFPVASSRSGQSAGQPGPWRPSLRSIGAARLVTVPRTGPCGLSVPPDRPGTTALASLTAQISPMTALMFQISLAPPDRPEPAAPRPRRSRAAKTRRRRGRRRLVTWGSVAIVAVVLVGVGFYLAQPTPKPKPFITTLQNGEFTAVPDACKAISAAVLGQILAGKPGKPVQISSSAGDSECTYQVDAKPIFRELDIKVQAFGPNLIAPGNGSATSYAAYSFDQGRRRWPSRPKRGGAAGRDHIDPWPWRPGVQCGAGLSPGQGHHRPGYRVPAVQERAGHDQLVGNASGGFGPVSTGLLEPGAVSVARDLLAVVKSQPTEG